MRSHDIDQWRLIIPVKGQVAAKTRLHPPVGVARADLAHAFALDTITAAASSMPPGHLVVVTSDRLTATFVSELAGTVLPDPGKGLNPAIRKGIDHVREVLGPGPTAILLGDIPTLRAQDLATALEKCSQFRRAFVPDAAGIGTVLLSALSPQDLDPQFGARSAREHARSCERLELQLPALRTDVDDDEALRKAMALGVGRHTAAVMGRERH